MSTPLYPSQPGYHIAYRFVQSDRYALAIRPLHPHLAPLLSTISILRAEPADNRLQRTNHAVELLLQEGEEVASGW
jgi:hypothetical protein